MCYTSYNIKFYRILYYLNILINVSNIVGAKTDKVIFVLLDLLKDSIRIHLGKIEILILYWRHK